ncbi:Hpt domain-containing protein [Moorena sp. SIO4E2]|uniref:Hpt domain-containing protein n=1 Tax=Moorena sp. SIO4E2 TaxID=2607826 RepID=UPI00338E2078
MRAAHSIKGGAASVGLEAIKTLAHRLEDIFKAFYSDEVVANLIRHWKAHL